MSILLQDLRYSLRILARNPGFTAVAILTLAIALGANTAVFSVMDGVLLRALPYPESDRIMDIAILRPPSEGRTSRKDHLDSESFQAWRKTARTVEQLAAYRTELFTLSGHGSSERLLGVSASATLLPLLRVAPAAGRHFRDEEEQSGLDRVVILSDRLWRQRFKGDPAILGKTITLEGLPYTVVGVMPRSFSFPTGDIQLWVPLDTRAPEGAGTINVQYLPVIARLNPGFSAQQAEAEAEAVARGQREGGAAPIDQPPGKVRLVPLRDEMVIGVRPALLAMFAAVSLVLLMACINLANLLLVQGSARQREMALRSAVGGSRGRLLRQVLTESTLLSFAGGTTGLLLAGWIHLLLPRFLPRDIPRLEAVHLDVRVFLFAVLLSGVTGLLFGLVPAWRSSGTNVIQPLYGGTVEARPSLRMQSLFVVAQVALAFLLLAGAGLLLRNFLYLVRIDPGYEPDHVLTATLDLDGARYSTPGLSEALFDDLLERLQRNRQVQAVGVVSFPPLTPSFSFTSLEIQGQPSARTLAVPQLSSPGYLQAMGLRLSMGRWLTRQDLVARAPVVVVNQAFVRQYLAGLKAIGRQLKVGTASLEIVGVVEDVHLLGLDSEPKPEIFASYHHAGRISGAGPKRLTLAVRTVGDPSGVLPSLRALVLDLDPNLALEDVQTMHSRLAASVAQPRFYALLLAAFAGMALVLAAAGVYGVLSYSVSRQTRAIGVRRALGAERHVILVLVLRKGFLLISIGVVLGVAIAAEASRALSHFLYVGVSPNDPLSFSVAALSLAAVTFFACYLPARRATRVDPGEALRYER
jgi:putative ABC transport system permease protein